MKTILLSLILFSSSIVSAQSLKKYAVGNSGCYIYNYCPTKFTIAYSEDSSEVYTGECTVSGVTYGVICIKLLNKVSDMDDAEELMLSYIEHLKSNLKIIKAVGYETGHQLKGRDDTRGLVDYWQDNSGDRWKIKSWTDGNFIGFMYAYATGKLPEAKVNAFLEGFRLPGM